MPESGRTIPAIIFRRVVLPQPLRPIRDILSPLSTLRSASSRRVRKPYLRETLFREIRPIKLRKLLLGARKSTQI